MSLINFAIANADIMFVAATLTFIFHALVDYGIQTIQAIRRSDDMQLRELCEMQATDFQCKQPHQKVKTVSQR